MWINNQVGISTTYETSCHTGIMQMTKLTISDKFIKLINYTPNLSSEQKGFEILDKIKVDDFVKFYSVRFNTEDCKVSHELMHCLISDCGIESPYRVTSQ